MAKKKQTLPDIKNQDPLEPINIAELGSNSDPCFGIGYILYFAIPVLHTPLPSTEVKGIGVSDSKFVI